MNNDNKRPKKKTKNISEEERKELHKGEPGRETKHLDLPVTESNPTPSPCGSSEHPISSAGSSTYASLRSPATPFWS